MKRKILAKRYAEAFIGYSRVTIGMEQAVEELKSLKVILRFNPDLLEFFFNPEIALVEKEQSIDNVLKDYFSNETRQFLKFLLEKERIHELVDICDYVRETYANGKAVEALLKTSYPLDLEVIEKIKEKLEVKLGKKLRLYLDLDAELLGGVQIRVGNVMIDGSVRRRLEELREKLMTVQV
jgi:F-type H+-transporting ATPase subunit delta